MPASANSRAISPDAPHVRLAVALAEAQVAAQAVAQVVPVEPVSAAPRVDQPRLDRDRDRRLARARQPREPHGRALLAQRLASVAARSTVASCQITFALIRGLSVLVDRRSLFTLKAICRGSR